MYKRQAHLLSLDKTAYQNCLRSLFATSPAAIIFTDQLRPSPKCADQARQTLSPLLLTTLPDYRVIRILQAYFSRPEAETTLLQGVFMEVLGKGVLLTGNPAVGKSEVALDLITRGHRLVADDAAEFTRLDDATLNGHCPPVLQDFLEVRGLGLINVRAMFGNSAIKPSKFLHLIIDLERLMDEELANIDRLNGSQAKQKILGVNIPQTRIPVAPGRNLAILVETAVRQHLLLSDGYSAAEDFARRQQKFIDRAAG